MRNLLTKIVVFIIFIATTIKLNSQQNLTLYSLENCTQSIYLNPGNKNVNRFYLSLPIGFQNIYLNHTGFAFNDLFTPRSYDDSLDINISNAISKMAASNNFSIDMTSEILGIGFRIKKKNFISFGILNKTQLVLNYPKDLLQLLNEGNGSSNFLGKRSDMDGLGIEANSYTEIALGINRAINSKLNVGLKLKLLSGIANIHTAESQIGLTTDATDFSLTLDGKMNVNSSNSLYFSDNNTAQTDELINSAFNFKNLGFAIDAGGSYQLTPKIVLTASILDLGFIHWKSNIKNYESSSINYTFKGVDLEDAIFNNENLGQNLEDTLNKIFNYQSNSTAYNAALHAKLYIGGSYLLNKYLTGNLTMYNSFFQSHYNFGIAAGLTFKVKKWFSANVNYSYIGRSAKNIGLGFNLHLGPVQFFLASDNIFSIYEPGAAKNIHVSTGLNIVIKPLKDKDGDGIKDKKDDCDILFGSKEMKGCPDTDNDGIRDIDDECPLKAGPLEFKGCPDTDKDGLIDKLDKCPEQAGKKELNGCPDNDIDGIIDIEDECPNEAGIITFKGCPDSDNDGIKNADDACPDQIGLLEFNGCPDTDSDKIIDKNDGCPLEFGPLENNGCPWGDLDKDGILDNEDACKSEAGSIENKGCPFMDKDQDGVLDKDDNCPETAGTIENKGCPKIDEKIEKILKTAFNDLEFETNKDVILSSSFQSLDELATVLIEKSDWKLEISGHTDNVGDAKKNMELSRKRAEAVKKFMIEKGVESTRLSVFYFGKTKPIASNNTIEGRQKNRRVEMKIAFN
jgi:outer membrane protein OmpA-like peptidoglycan-associated protein